MNALTITQKIEVAEGPTIQEILATIPGAYDVIDLTLGVVTNKEISLCPACAITLLAILVPDGVYDGGSTPYVSYKIASASNPAIILDRMHMFNGAGAIAAIAAGAANPEKLFITNTHATMEIKVIVGRAAIPL